MAKFVDLSDSATAEIFDRTSSAITQNHSYALSHKSRANDAANEELDGGDQASREREQSESALTDVDDLLAIEIWKPDEPQFCRSICAHYGVKPRTVQKWFTSRMHIYPPK